ncbi:hypothetical protein evm_002206 [Chilo suppressalis]|nr:hypothetical protein evm_002206 [Chilo suppressalis]
MSTVFSKGKEKRSRSPNEANNSFVKNVTSRVSGLLPTSITKWFGSPSTSNANGSAPAADATDSSTEDEAPESPTTAQPPAKRARLNNSPGKYNHYASSTDLGCHNVDTFDQSAPYNNSVQSPPGRTMFRRESNFMSTPVRTPTVESVKDKGERDITVTKSQHTLSSVSSSISSKRKSIFDNPNKEISKRACVRTANNTVVDPKAPCFKPSLFGSPFYPGQTMYGGAASIYINQPNIQNSKVALVKESKSSDDSSMSYSARRVMDLLENYSSPLMEAKRISQYIKSTKKGSFNESTSVSGSPYCPKVMSYKTQELHVPDIVSVLRLKQKSRLMDTTNAARQIIASQSNTSDYIPYPSKNTQRDQADTETSSKFTTKVKSRLTRPKRGESEIESQMITPVNLPTAVLQIDKDNMPKFSLGTILPSTSTPSSNTAPKLNFTSTLSKPVSEATSQDTALNSPATSSPKETEKSLSLKTKDWKCPDCWVVNKTDTPKCVCCGAQQLSKETKDWKCPDCWVLNKADIEKCVCCGAQKQSNKSKDWKCPDCWVLNKADIEKCVCCGAQQTSKKLAKQSKCSICKLADSQSNSDKCVNCEKVQINSTTKLPSIQNVEDSSKWKCEDCWVKNDNNADKCVCCGGKNPKKSTGTLNSSSSVNSVNAVDSQNEWKCLQCYVKNKIDVDKCVCGAIKPGTKTNNCTVPSIGSTALPNDSEPFLKINAKTPSNTWECTSCLVRNENNRSKCVCCEADKPGTISESVKKLFNFHKPSEITFKFGINLATQDVNSKPVEEKPIEVPKKPEESETNNNILPKTPSFSFGIPSKKADNQTDTVKILNPEPAKLNFTFGIPKTQTATEPVVSKIFGSTNKLGEFTPKSVTQEDEKVQEVPKVDLSLQTQKDNMSKPMTGIFGSQLASPPNQVKPIETKLSLLGSTSSADKKDALSNPLTIPPMLTSSQATPTQSNFTFKAPGIKPAVNLFAAPATTTSTFVAPVQVPSTTPVSLFKPEITTTTASSLFQKPETITTNSVSLFQKTDTATLPTKPTLGATLFNFNNNSTSSVDAQPEKPKFNFTFGSNMPTGVFNNAFGAASTESNTSTNKFNLSGNRLATVGNGLASSATPAGGNGLTANKVGNTNEIPANSMANRNELQPTATGIFGAPVQKENLWSSSNNNSANLFVSNASSAAPPQKPPAFSFGSATPFNASGASPAFGSTTTPTQNVFGMSQQSAGSGGLFSSPVASQPAPSIFSGGQPAGNAPLLFGGNNVGAAPAFGAAAAAPAIPAFDTPALAPAPAPAPAPTPTFNFGATQQTGIFGFGQQQQQPQQPQQAGVYSFGAPTGAPQVQFNMGSAPNTGMRRMRKAVRRNPQR